MVNKKILEAVEDENLLVVGRVVYFLVAFLKKALNDKYIEDPHYCDADYRPYILLGSDKYVSKEVGMSVLEISKNVDNLVFTDLRTNGGSIKNKFGDNEYIRDEKDGEKLAYVEPTDSNKLKDISGANCSVLQILSANERDCFAGCQVSQKVVERIINGLENLEEQGIEILEYDSNDFNIDMYLNEAESLIPGKTEIYNLYGVKVTVQCDIGWINLFYTLEFDDGLIMKGSYDMMNRIVEASTDDNSINFIYSINEDRVYTNKLYDNDDDLYMLIFDILECAEDFLQRNVYDVVVNSLEDVPS